MENNYDIDNIKNHLKNKTAISKFLDEEKNMNRKFIKPVVAACIVVIFSFGIVFAKEIEILFRDFFEDRGIETAIDNGYIEEPEMDYIEVLADVRKGNSKETIDKINTKVKIKDFLMSDDVIRFTTVIEFDENINKYKDFTKEAGELNYLNYISGGEVDPSIMESIGVNDLFILDEEDRLLASPCFMNSKEIFDNFCNQHNLDFEYEKFSENYFSFRKISSGFEITKVYPEERKIEGIWSVYADSKQVFPRSKHLMIYFSEISFISKYSSLDNSDDIHLIGDWEIELNVPETMVKRKNIKYTVESCNNSDFEIFDAYATDTFFEIDFKIKNVEHIVYPAELGEYEQEHNTGYECSKQGIKDFFKDEKLIKLWEDYTVKKDIINFYKRRKDGEGNYVWKATEGTHIIDSQNRRHDISEVINAREEYITNYDENGIPKYKYTGIADFKLRFDMTKYDITDSLKVFIDYNRGEDALIILKKDNK